MTIVATNNKEINDLKLKLQVEVDSETINTKLCKIKAKVDLLEKNMKEFKIRKFRRDTRD